MRILYSITCVLIFPVISLAQEDIPPSKSVSLPFEVSTETTLITEPLTEAGRLDYGAALNQMMKKGVTPETNAAVYYWRAIGPQPDGLEIEGFVDNMKKELGVDPFSENGP